MSLRSTVRAMPTLLRVGFSSSVAYRAELIVWILTTTMPFIMLSLWDAVAREAPVGRYGPSEFRAYFLATFIVRQLTGAWAAWYINFEVRTGTLAMRLLRPVSALWAYAAENLAALPLRLVIAVPVGILAVSWTGGHYLPRDFRVWVVWGIAMLGGWLITFLVNVAIGALSLYMESSIKVMDVWLALYFVFSGYLYPVEFFPPALRRVVEWLPFRYQIGFPVELMTSVYTFPQALWMLLRQWLWVALMGLGCHWMWRRGVRRFAAYGG